MATNKEILQRMGFDTNNLINDIENKGNKIAKEVEQKKQQQKNNNNKTGQSR